MDTRKHILKTALSLFISKSYKAVTMAELERATGLTKGAFYHYFKSKEEIFIEVINTYYLSDEIFSNPELSKNGSLKENIEYMLEQIDEKIAALKDFTSMESFDPHLFSLMIEAKEYYPKFMEKAKIKEQSILNRWELIILNAKNNNEIKPDLDTNILAENLMAVATSLIKNVFREKPLEYSMYVLKMQYDQLYRLIKI